jgi:hypothetical protein
MEEEKSDEMKDSGDNTRLTEPVFSVSLSASATARVCYRSGRKRGQQMPPDTGTAQYEGVQGYDDLTSPPAYTDGLDSKRSIAASLTELAPEFLAFSRSVPQVACLDD